MIRYAYLLFLWALPVSAEVRLNHLTTNEVSEAVSAGYTTVIIPTGGTEQNGAHMVLGKHNLRVAYLSQEIAHAAGRTLVAPVIDYVPEGRIDPPQGHMQYAGTISIPEELFALTVEYAARSLYQAGFEHIILLGDSGGNQQALQNTADKLNREWRHTPVLYAGAYYETNSVFVDWLQSEGYTAANGGHAGLADTSLLLAITPGALRPFSEGHPGVGGNAESASAELGRVGLEMFVTRTVAQIREFRGH